MKTVFCGSEGALQSKKKNNPDVTWDISGLRTRLDDTGGGGKMLAFARQTKVAWSSAYVWMYLPLPCQIWPFLN